MKCIGMKKEGNTTHVERRNNCVVFAPGYEGEAGAAEDAKKKAEAASAAAEAAAAAAKPKLTGKCVDKPWLNNHGHDCAFISKDKWAKGDWTDKNGVRADVACCKFGGGERS